MSSNGRKARFERVNRGSSPRIGTIVFLLAFQAQAQCAPDTIERRVVLEHEGTPGIWFPLAVAKCIASDLSDLRFQRSHSALVIEKSKLQDEALKLQAEELRLETEKSAVLEKTSAAMAKKIEQLTPSWYEHPVLLLGIGAVAGALAVTTIFVVTR